MPTIDSRQSSIAPDVPIYQTSEPMESDWGQPSISHYVFYVEDDLLVGNPIGGVYLQVEPTKDLISTDGLLASELSSWDIASDEALENFEAGLD